MNLRIVLVRPRDPNNIGAAARAMANFGLSDLWVVAPHPPVWREAKSAVGAAALLKRAREARTLEEALAGCRGVWATSSMKGRRPRVPVCDLPDFPPAPGRTAVLFGPEKTGLTAEELAYASAVLRIRTTAACPSMNLAAAVGVFCYAWSGGSQQLSQLSGNSPRTAPLEQKGWSAGERTRRLKAAVYRSNLTADEAGMAMELLRRMAALTPALSRTSGEGERRKA
ncbi:MAG: RNA methyltransferase [Elusimicrobia bacterium]|nr:RNA methyltransferase [Elusimicrobiota bacterium]